MTSLDFWTIMPEAALALFTLVALLLGSFTGKDAQGRTILWLTVVALLVAAFADAFLRGMAAGSATVMHPGTDLCRREDVDRLHAELLGRGRP